MLDKRQTILNKRARSYLNKARTILDKERVITPVRVVIRRHSRHSPSEPSVPSGFLMPNFSNRYCNVRKVRPNNFAAFVML